MVGVEKDNIIIKIGTSAIIRVFFSKTVIIYVIIIAIITYLYKVPTKR